MKLKIDSREQKKLEFRQGIFDEIVIEGMPVGDYMAEINGVEIPITFERKGFSDLWGTMTSGYPRFKRELERAKEFGLTVILLIEGSMREVSKGFDRSQYSGDSMLKKLAMLRVRYDLEYHFFNDRREMSRYIEEIFDACNRNYCPPKD